MTLLSTISQANTHHDKNAVHKIQIWPPPREILSNKAHADGERQVSFAPGHAYITKLEWRNDGLAPMK